MGFFGKLFKGPEIDMEKSDANVKKMRLLFNQVVENGDTYQLIFGYTEDVSWFNYGFVHGSKTKIGNLIVGWNEETKTIVVVPTVPDLSGCGDCFCDNTFVQSQTLCDFILCQLFEITDNQYNNSLCCCQIML